MVSKIEAAERLAESVERLLSWQGQSDLPDAIAAYRSASVPSDELTDEEREVIVDAMQAYLVGDPKCEPARSILCKLGNETKPEPVWWTNYDEGTIVLSGKDDVSMAELSFQCETLRAWAFPDNAKASDKWTVSEAKAWCEQQLRNANLKGATDGKQN